MFFNELDILDIRFNELYNTVDKFVIVESIETHTGNPKPLYFAENRDRFQKFMEKVIYIPLYEHIVTDSPWDREGYQRDQILQGLKDCADDDIILVSDVDEIPKSSLLKKVASRLKNNRNDIWIVFDQKLYRFFLNQFDYIVFPWPGSYATTYKWINSKSPTECRVGRNDFLHLPDSGWHFSSMGGLESWVKKIESFPHSEEDRPEHKTMEYIRYYLNRDCKLVEIDDTYPDYIRQNLQNFINMGYIDK